MMDQTSRCVGSIVTVRNLAVQGAKVIKAVYESRHRSQDRFPGPKVGHNQVSEVLPRNH